MNPKEVIVEVLVDIVNIHVMAEGPVSFESIMAYCAEQFNDREFIDTHLEPEACVADALTECIKRGMVALYEPTYNEDTEKWDLSFV